MEALRQAGTPALDRIVRPAGRPSALRLRSAGSHDVAEIARFVRELGADTRHRRGHVGMGGTSDRSLQRTLGAKSPLRHTVVVEGRGMPGRPVVAMGQIAPDDDATGEIAVVVADAWRGLGLGGVVLTALHELAEPRYRHLSAYVEPGNTPLIALLHGAAAAVTAERHGAVLRLRWPVPTEARRRAAAA